MEPTHVAAILAALANGDDPFTGLPLAEGHVLKDDRVKAALAAAAGLIDPEMKLDQVQWTAEAPPAAAGRERKGQAWTAEEEQRLVAGFDAGLSAATIAQEMGRTAGAIRSRLIYLGLKVVETPKGDVRFLKNFEAGHLLSRCLDRAVLARAARLLRAEDPGGAGARMEAAVERYAARGDAPAELRAWAREGVNQ